MDTRVARCRMLNAKSDQCTGQALDPDGEALICARHAGLVLELLTARGGQRPAGEGFAGAVEGLTEIYEGLVALNRKLEGMARREPSNR